jgi:type IV pilus assembly protein PilV
MKNSAGMTLVEVLVALAITFIIFLGLSDAGLVVLNENIKNSMRDEAVSVAELEMQQVRNIPFSNINSIHNTTYPVHRQIRGFTADYTVSRTVANPDNTTPATDPTNRQVTINVGWTRHQKSYGHQVVTIVRQR